MFSLLRMLRTLEGYWAPYFALLPLFSESLFMMKASRRQINHLPVTLKPGSQRGDVSLKSKLDRGCRTVAVRLNICLRSKSFLTPYILVRLSRRQQFVAAVLRIVPSRSMSVTDSTTCVGLQRFCREIINSHAGAPTGNDVSRPPCCSGRQKDAALALSLSLSTPPPCVWHSNRVQSWSLCIQGRQPHVASLWEAALTLFFQMRQICI